MLQRRLMIVATHAHENCRMPQQLNAEDAEGSCILGTAPHAPGRTHVHDNYLDPQKPNVEPAEPW